MHHRYVSAMSRAASIAAGHPPIQPGFVPGGPERLFAVDDLDELSQRSCTASMPTGPWLTAVNGATAEVGALGVLMDITLGYLINAAGAAWSVSTEMSMDVTGSIDITRGPLACTARLLHKDAFGALAAGIVTDGAGTEVVHCTMRGRYLRADLPVPDEKSVVAPRRHQEPDRTSLNSLLSPDVRPNPTGLRVHVSDRLTNPRGMLHGGIVLTLIERAASEKVPGPFRTAAMRVQWVRGVPRDNMLDVIPEVLHLGRSLGVVQVLVRDDAGRTCATATVTRQHDPGANPKAATATPSIRKITGAPYSLEGPR